MKVTCYEYTAGKDRSSEKLRVACICDINRKKHMDFFEKVDNINSNADRETGRYIDENVVRLHTCTCRPIQLHVTNNSVAHIIHVSWNEGIFHI